MDNPQKHVPTEQARGGSTENVVRYVLGISLGLAIVVMLFLLLM